MTTIMGAASGTRKTLMGASNLSVSQHLVGPVHVARAFNPSQAAQVPAGIPIMFSDDTNRNDEYALAHPTTAITSMWESKIRNALPDNAHHYVAILHEEDTPPNQGSLSHAASVARWKACYAGLGGVVRVVNQGRQHPIRVLSITTGQPYSTNTYQDWDSPDVDVIGVDNYSRHHYPTIDAWARSKGKPWVLPEWGLDASHAAPDTRPSVYEAAMNLDYPQFAGKAEAVCWWFSGRNDLSAHASLAPAVALLRSLIAK